jgi:hypothetical protein
MSVGINERVVGTCGNCGGPVVVPIYFHSVVMPTPTCRGCGATVKADYGPRLPMNPRRHGCGDLRKWVLRGPAPRVTFECSR